MIYYSTLTKGGIVNMQNMDKKITKLNNKIIKNQEKLSKTSKESDRAYTITGIFAAAVTSAGSYVLLDSLGANNIIAVMTAMAASYTEVSLILGETSESIKEEIDDCLDKLHGYALEENRQYENKVFRKK